jgi:hypothetical protein
MRGKAMGVQSMNEQATGEQGAAGAGSSSAWRARYVAALLAALPLALFGELLVRRTHHRPLGAATFASAAVLGLALTWWFTSHLSGRVSADRSPALVGRSVGRPVSRLVEGLAAVGLLVVIVRLIG